MSIASLFPLHSELHEKIHTTCYMLYHMLYLNSRTKLNVMAAMAEWGVKQKEKWGERENKWRLRQKKLTLGERRQNVMTSSGGI